MKNVTYKCKLFICFLLLACTGKTLAANLPIKSTNDSLNSIYDNVSLEDQMRTLNSENNISYLKIRDIQADNNLCKGAPSNGYFKSSIYIIGNNSSDNELKLNKCEVENNKITLTYISSNLSINYIALYNRKDTSAIDGSLFSLSESPSDPEALKISHELVSADTYSWLEKSEYVKGCSPILSVRILKKYNQVLYLVSGGCTEWSDGRTVGRAYHAIFISEDHHEFKSICYDRVNYDADEEMIFTSQESCGGADVGGWKPFIADVDSNGSYEVKINTRGHAYLVELTPKGPRFIRDIGEYEEGEGAGSSEESTFFINRIR